MNNEKMGQFISELRKAKQLTQKDLAAKLNITDKSVSKWERGLSCPDIALLSPLADILGITINELLNGEKSATANTYAEAEASVVTALQYADKAVKSEAKTMTAAVQNIFFLSYSVLLLLGILTCAICDIAINGAFTWSLIPISTSVFAWLAFSPAIKFGGNGIVGSLAVLTVLVIPYFYVLSLLLKINAPFMSISVSMSIIGIVFCWVVYGLFRILKPRKLIALAVSLLLVIPVDLIINFILSKIISGPLFDVWDAMSSAILIAAAIALFVLDSARSKRKSSYQVSR